MFAISALEDQFSKWAGQVADEPRGAGVSALDALTAHYLLAEFFHDEDCGAGNIGPRDESCHLLHSALGRQNVEFFGQAKWQDHFERAASMMFGLVKNHPFRDGNKRTGLLLTLYLLEQNGFMPRAAADWEELVVSVAAGDYQKSPAFAEFARTQSHPAPDLDVYFLAAQLRALTHARTRTAFPLSYRQLQRRLEDHGFVFQMRGAHDLALYSVSARQIMGVVRIYRMNDLVNSVQLEKIRGWAGLTVRHGVPDEKFYRHVNCLEPLVMDFRQTFRNLQAR